nr:zinc finger, CCHC-type [Tanacetum cinerariifolium]
MKSEFMALAAVGKEAEWLRNLILEILLCSKPIAPISIHYDSAATLAKAYSQMYNGKSRHLGVRHNMICELITNMVISIEFVRSQQNLADHLTKGLARDLVIKSAEEIILRQHIGRTVRGMSPGNVSQLTSLTMEILSPTTCATFPGNDIHAEEGMISKDASEIDNNVAGATHDKDT